MASKETTAAGFINVSREITGEPQRDFFFFLEEVFERRSSCLKTRGDSLPSLSRSLNLRFLVRFIWKELSPQASAGNVSPGRSRVNGCGSSGRL